jgi:hypothetical protein
MSEYFTQADTWNGGYYELALAIGPRSDERLAAAQTHLWAYPALEGCYLKRNQEPGSQPRVSPPKQIKEDESPSLLGLARLPNNIQVACGTILVREDEGTDWLDFFMPMGALSRAYNVGGYPLGDVDEAPERWQNAVDHFLAEIGSFVFAIVPFRLGLIGLESGGNFSATEIIERGVPDERDIGYLWPEAGKLSSFPRNRP